MIEEVEALRIEFVNKVIELTGIEPVLVHIDVSFYEQRNTSQAVKEAAAIYKMEQSNGTNWYSTDGENGSVVVFLGAK